MTINTEFAVGDTIWYVDSYTRLAVSGAVSRIKIEVSGTTTIKYVVSTAVETEVLSTNAFASQADLAASFNPAP